MIRLVSGAKFRAKTGSRRNLPIPAARKLRIAQISATGQRLYSAHSFPVNGWARLEAFRPQVLMGSFADLKSLATRVQARELHLESVDHALLVITRCGEQLMSPARRALLWHAFGVPVYELLVSSGGIAIASECEAYEGWHVEPGKPISISRSEIIFGAGARASVPTGLTGELATEPCPCGRPGIRLTKLAVLEAHDERPLAATA